jgi:uncharacterized protein (DUF2062 family)
VSTHARLRAAWRRRRARARWLLAKVPLRSNANRYPGVRWFAGARERGYLWSFRAAHVLPAIYAGSVLALLPTYGVQIPIAVAAAFLLRANLTVAVGVTMVNNPLTAAPIYFATDRVGIALLDAVGAGAALGIVARHTVALVVGAVVVGLALGAGIDLVRRFAAWEARAFRRRLEAARAAG